jgi:hypothetical protein
VAIASFTESLVLLAWFMVAAAFLGWIVRAWMDARGGRRR